MSNGFDVGCYHLVGAYAGRVKLFPILPTPPMRMWRSAFKRSQSGQIFWSSWASYKGCQIVESCVSSKELEEVSKEVLLGR